MGNRKYTSFLCKSAFALLLSVGGTMSVFALPGFVVDGVNSVNSTGPCVGKTVCHISGDLTYSDITLINGWKLSHRQGSLTVSNNFVIGGTGATGSGFFVGQNLTVGNQLVMRGDSVLALNSNLTSDPASSNITDWMGASYYDLQVTNTNLAFTGMDVNLSTSCTTLGGGTTLSACIQTRNVNINSKLSATAGATNVVWKTYANGYLAVDSDTTLTNIKMDIAGYFYTQWNVFGSFSSSHYLYVYGGQLVSTPDAVGFTTAGIRVDSNMYLTGSASLPDLYMQGANGTAAANIYVSGSLTTSQMSLGLTSKTTGGSLANITVKNGSFTASGSDTVYFNGNVFAGKDITLTNDTTLDGNNVTSNIGNIAVTTGTTHSYGVIAVNNGTLSMSGITTLNRNGDITAKSNIAFTSITTSSGSTTNVTSTAGAITVMTGTTHTYQDLTALGAINFSGISNSLTNRNISNSGSLSFATIWTLTNSEVTTSGSGAFTNITTYNRNGNITAASDVVLTNVNTSSGITTDITSTAGNILIQSGTTHTYQDITALGNVTYSGVVTNLTTRNITNTGTTALLNIPLFNRLGNITTWSDITLTNVTTSSGTTNLTSLNGNLTINTGTTHTYGTINVNNGALTVSGLTTLNRLGHITIKNDITLTAVTTSYGATTNMTSTAGNIILTTGTTHTYNYINAYKDNTVTSIVAYNVNNISTNGGLVVTGSTLNITDMTDATDENAQNLDISTGSGFIITNSTANLANSSIQSNGYLDINNTTWVSQNLNVNGYTTLSGERVGIYFHGNKDRTIYGTLFAGGGSIWVGTSATADDGNIFLKRKWGVTTNGNIRMYRSSATIIDAWATAPETTPTINKGLFTQLYDAALASNSWSVTVLTGSATNPNNLIDGNTTTTYESATADSALRFDFARDMIISKLCVTTGVNSPENLKLQFMDATSTIINTQAQKLPSASQARACFDLNSYKARKILVTGYGSANTLGFGEIEFWGVPADTANIAAPFGNDIVIQNGSYEFGGVITSGNFSVASTPTTKKLRVTQYHNNAPFNNKASINLTSIDANGTILTHSVGNEIGLKFITDTMNVGAGVVIDTVGKGYLGGNAKSEPQISTGYTGLYSFTSHTFTPCGAILKNWPSLANCRSAYSGTIWAANTSYLNMVTNGIQEWTVPITGIYTIDAYGAGYAIYGGGGARIKWDITLTQGQKLRILVGQQWSNGRNSAITGAGGTFVTTIASSPIIVAGGGGGSYYPIQNYQQIGWQTTTNGWYGYEYGWQQVQWGTSGAWGNCWSSYTTCQWGGGGMTGNGNGSWYGTSFTNGGVGGCYSYCGGFGGGGGTTSWYGGGGGGYSGGGGGYSGGNQNYSFAGGGGSYLTGTLADTVSISGANGWEGQVIITYNAPIIVPPGTAGNITPGSTRIGAGDGGYFGWFGGYGVSGGGGGGGASSSYTFSSHTFTSCGTSGRTGPSISTCRTSYGAGVPWTQDPNYLTMTVNGIQEWTVPASGAYTIDAYGAWVGSYGGGGARIKWDVNLIQGQKIKILVGQTGYNDNSSQTAGNGGTFVTTSMNDPIMIAGWWAGNYAPSKNIGDAGGQITTNGGSCIVNTTTQPRYSGGINGGGGTANSSNTCWWAGLINNGDCPSTAAQSFVNGWVGWIWAGGGGFWGGAGVTSWAGGGGGGYSGWAGCYNGSNNNYPNAWGWWSFNVGINQINTAGTWTGNGKVTINYIGSAFVAGVSAAAGAGNLGYGGYGGSTTCTGSLGNNTLGNTKGGNGGGVTGGSGSNWHGGGGATGCTGGGGGTGGNSDSNPYRLGSGGGAGGLVTNNYTNGYGGNGGGMIRISANTLTLSGKLMANGNAGKDYLSTTIATNGAGAGGAGGSILIRAKSLTCIASNSVEVRGGNGGAGASSTAGGGGAGGGVITYYYTNKTGTCNGYVTAGTGGLNGWAAGGQDGLVYESVGTTFDTLKSRVTIENSPAAADGSQAVTVRAYFLDVNGVPLENEYLVAEVVGDIGTGTINNSSPLPQTDANGMIAFPITSTVKGIKKVVLKNAVTYTELQEQPTFTFGIPQVSISKTANKSSVNSGDIVTYTIALSNSGSGDAGWDTENAIIVEDVLPTGFMYYTTGPTAGSKWDTGSGTTQYYLFPEVTGDGTAGNEQRLRYSIADGLSGPPKIAAGAWVRILFDSKAP